MLNTREGLSDSDDFEKPFRDKLPDLEGMPPQESWEAIQTALDRDRGIDRRWYLLALLLLLVGSGGFIGGYLVSQVRIEAEQLVVIGGDGQFQIPDSKFQKNESGQAPLLEEQDCVEVCEDDVDDADAAPGRNARDRDSRNAGDDDRIMGGDVARISRKRKIDSDAAHDTSFSTESTVAKEEDLFSESPVDDVLDDSVYTKKMTPGNVTTHVTGQGKTKGQMDSDRNDSTVQMLNGPLRPLYAHHDGVSAASAVGVDSVQKMDEITDVPLPGKADSVAKKKKEFESSKWTLQLSVGGSYAFKKLTPSEDLYYVTDLTNKNKFSWSNTGYHIAARVRREIGSKTTLTAGLSWSRWRTYIGYNYYDVVADSMAVQQITANSIEVNTYFMKRGNEISTTVQQVGLSVGVLRKVRVLRRSHTVLLEANLYQKIYATSQSARSGHNVEVRPMHFAIKAGVEKTVDIGAWRFTLTPYIQRYLGSLYTAESVFLFSPLQVGLDVGMLLPLQKK
jgi:hypothetical protein